MIKFFRTIRQDLFKEGKTRKYLKYALGEIMLVVIGILIALGINNWNQNRNNTASANLHLKTIAQNIKEDLVQLNYMYQFTDTTLIYAEKLTRQFQTLDPIDDNTTMYMFYLLLEKSTSPNKSGLETINNSGELSYVDQDVQDMILNYYTTLDHILAREDISNTFIKIRYEPYFFEHYSFTVNSKTNWKPIRDYYKDDPRTPQEIDPTSFINDNPFETMVFGRYFQIQQQHGLYKNAIDLANQLLTKINAHAPSL
ncbi:DUF6090 family protein [Allomuricauda sp. NBRC 101325]|uniref:DUF6090 family protein n=1 Tax=Allomuricauda sp. NBRC 101325 TaxID=1113758 RepID=UPI0024A1E624|nr:DUF6090 family protein [Muricauda sp. NBRC 101325]GLU44700.1 hypothetical protein Musp01_23240 [Muricauda sp. NBRC 101325]